MIPSRPSTRGEHPRRGVSVVAERVDEAEGAEQQQVDAGDQREREQRHVGEDEREDAGDRAEHAGDDQQRPELPHVTADLRLDRRGGGHAPTLGARGVSAGHTARVISTEPPGASTATRTSGASSAAWASNSRAGSPLGWWPMRR